MCRYNQLILGLLIVLVLFTTACSSAVDNSVTSLQRGLNLLEQNDYKTAYQYFDEVIEENPQYAEAYYYRAYALSQFGLIEPSTPVPPTKLPDPVFPATPELPTDSTDIEARFKYLEELRDIAWQSLSVHATAEQNQLTYENALIAYEQALIEHNEAWATKRYEAIAQIAADIGKALELGLPPDLEQRADELLQSFLTTP